MVNRDAVRRMMVKQRELAKRRAKYLKSQGFSKTDDQLTYTDRGWPRPMSPKYGLRIPWVSPAEQLKRTHPDRMNEVVEYALCQVCGEGPEDADEFVYALVNGEVSPNPDEIDLTTKVVQAMDNAVMHYHCMRLATGQCPELKCLRAEGNLFVFKSQAKQTKIYTIGPESADEANKVGEQVLGVPGEFVEHVSWDDIHGKNA